MIHLVQKADNLPKVLCERYSSADGASLKVALHLLINGDCEISDIASSLEMREEVVTRAVKFWQDCGLMEDTLQCTCGEEPSVVKRKAKMNHSQMAEAALSDPEIAGLLQGSQMLMKRELSISETRLLIETYEETLLPVAVILLIESFLASSGTQQIKIPSKTASLAREFAKEGIDTVGAAEVKIGQLEKREEYYDEVAKLLKTDKSEFSSREKSFICQWYEKFDYDIAFVDEVLIRKQDANIPYIHSVLKEWHKKKYTSISDTRLTPSNVQPEATMGTDDSIDPFIRDMLKNMIQDKD